ncbi:MAG TPA: transcription termination/antitermination protein NusG [Treponemataceae bacterium]|nr:transcription termination/antitermination protein NusG [Treponemataceae bacterium]
MAKGWYILHTYSGYENKIEKTIRILIESKEISPEIVLDIKVPVEEVIEVKDGKKRTVTKKFLPGYILIEMDLPDLGWKGTCAAIRKIQGVTGFVGTPSGVRPQPISSDEARAILQKAGELKGEKPSRMKQSFEIGETVKIIDGPFDSFTGTIEDVNPEKSKLRVMVGIFGRATPVEVDLLQVEKI